MKRKITLFSTTLALILFIGYSCSSDDYLNDREIQNMIDNSLNGQWQIVSVEIKGSDWVWYESAVEGEREGEGYYHASVDLPELTEYIFDEGAVIAYHKFDNNSKTALPFVKTREGTNGLTYTETYSCDFVLGNPSQATFYLEASDLGRYDNNPLSALFQVILIY